MTCQKPDLSEQRYNRFRLTVLATVATLFSVLPSPAIAQSKKPTVVVVDHIWGFDGRVQPGQFNPLSILLDNQTDEAIEVDAKLQRTQGSLNISGGEYVEPVFIAPAARRWIQFFPYIANSYQTEWRLTINDNNGGGRFRNVLLEEIQQPRPSYKNRF